MSILSKLFGTSGSASAKTPEGAEYGGFKIYAEPIAEGKTYRIAARITGEVDGEAVEHQLIRADTLQSHDDAVEASLNKAKQVIDEQGARLFR